jgi:hypothetical protein
MKSYAKIISFLHSSSLFNWGGFGLQIQTSNYALLQNQLSFQTNLVSKPTYSIPN